MIKKFTLLLSCLAIATIANAQLTVTANPTAGPSCNNGTNGSATLNFSGCTGPFTYTINGGTPVVSNTATASLTNLAAGTYTVAVTTPGGGSGNIFEDDFEGANNWTLNTSSGTNGGQANLWVINAASAYDGSCDPGAGNKSLHITCSGLCSLLGNTALYNETGAGNATDKFVSTTNNISTVGRTNLVLKFAYQCEGEAGFDYGNVRYSINGGTNWVDLPTQYAEAGSWTCATVNLPQACENISTLKLGFRWRNGGDGIGFDPPFNIDHVVLTGNGGGGSGCTATTTFTLDNPAPFVPTTNLTGNVNLCQGEVLTLSATNANNCTPVTITGEGTYTLTCQNQAGCSGTSAPVVVTLVNDPVANFTYTQIDNYTVEFTSTGSGATTYEWSLSDNVIGSGSTLSYDFSADGNYNITLIVSNACGSDTIILPVQVIKVGVNESAFFSAFDLFPNPASSQVMLQLNAVKPVNGVIKVVTPLGQIVAEEVIKFNGAFNKTFDITNLASGIYSIVITTEGKSFSRKLVIE